MKKYLCNLVKQNKTILILFSIIAFIFMPLISFSMKYDSIEYYGAFSQILMMVLVYISTMSSFSFLFKKNKADLYFQLPLSRRNLYKAHFIYSFITSFTISAVFYLLSVLAINFTIKLVLLNLLILITNGIIVFGITTYICTITRKLIDAIIITAAYVGLILIVYLVLEITFSSIITYGSGNYHGDFTRILIYFFYPAFIVQMTAPSVMPTQFYVYVYYIAFTLFAYFYSYKSFIHTKIEEIEGLSLNKLGYPLMIILYNICMSIFFHNMSDYKNYYLIYYIILALLFSIGMFFSKRKIFVNKILIVLFVAIQLVGFTTVKTINDTNGFNMVIEVPTESIKKVSIELSISDQTSMKQTYTDTYSINHIKASHKEVVSELKNDKINYDEDLKNSYMVYFKYKTSKGKEIMRQYNLDKSHYQQLKNNYFKNK